MLCYLLFVLETDTQSIGDMRTRQSPIPLCQTSEAALSEERTKGVHSRGGRNQICADRASSRECRGKLRLPIPGDADAEIEACLRAKGRTQTFPPTPNPGHTAGAHRSLRSPDSRSNNSRCEGAPRVEKFEGFPLSGGGKCHPSKIRLSSGRNARFPDSCF